MNKIISLATLSCCICLFSFETANATKPGEVVNPNGFPSGEHYNLNIHGKSPGFTCPDLEYDELGNPVYGNSIFVPETGEGIQILMESGSGKGKKTETILTLQATDPCSKPFDNDAAVVQLPPNEKGYTVYARALASPTDSPFMTVEGDLVSVEDDYGNDLVYLGLVTSDGFTTPDATFTRLKGKSKAVPITGLFEWTGDVCYFDSTNYCLEEECTETALCCTDTNSDGIYEECVNNDLLELCPEGSIAETAACKEYINEWVFNIGDFVTYLWDTNNNGLKLLQVRFYPVK